MSNYNQIDSSIPVAPLALIVHDSAKMQGRDIDNLISKKRKKYREKFVNNPVINDYYKNILGNFLCFWSLSSLFFSLVLKQKLQWLKRNKLFQKQTQQ